jgi:hypothetical protein
VNVDRYADRETVPSFANRWPCGKCGAKRSAVRPAWHKSSKLFPGTGRQGSAEHCRTYSWTPHELAATTTYASVVADFLDSMTDDEIPSYLARPSMERRTAENAKAPAERARWMEIADYLQDSAPRWTMPAESR